MCALFLCQTFFLFHSSSFLNTKEKQTKMCSGYCIKPGMHPSHLLHCAVASLFCTLRVVFSSVEHCKKKVAANMMMLHSGSMKRSSCFFTSAKFVNFHITSSSRLKWCFICFSPTQSKVFSCLKSTLVIAKPTRTERIEFGTR